MADARARRNDLEIVERLASPLQEFVSLAVALIFELDVLLECTRITEFVDHYAVVDDEVHWDERIDLLRVAAEPRHRIAHGGKVDDGGNSGEILHEHPRRTVLNFTVDPSFLEPVGHALEIVAGDGLAVLEPEQILEQHFHRIGKARDVAEGAGRFLQ